MKLQKDYMLVRELQKDFMVDGLIQKYDDSSNVMYGKVIDASDTVLNYLSTVGYLSNMVVMFKRLAKIVPPGLNGYLVSFEDVIAILTKEEFEKL